MGTHEETVGEAEIMSEEDYVKYHSTSGAAKSFERRLTDSFACRHVACLPDIDGRLGALPDVAKATYRCMV